MIIKYINIDTYNESADKTYDKPIEKFSNLENCIFHYSKLILTDYETNIIEIDTFIKWNLFDSGLSIIEIPKKYENSEFDIKINMFVITATGMMIQAVIKKK
jgi:hypothetical protein